MGCIQCPMQMSDHNQPLMQQSITLSTNSSNTSDEQIEDNEENGSSESENVYIPEIEAIEVQNGIIKLKICNLSRDSFWFKYCHKMEFELFCDKLCKSILFNFKSLFMVPFVFIMVRVPMHIYNYNISFKLKVRFINNNNKWFGPSNITSIDVPSSLIQESQFKIGDTIKYRPENVYFPKWGTIKQVLTENYVEIEDYNEKKHFLSLPTSRIYQPTLRLANLLDFSDRLNVDKCILLNNMDNDIIIKQYESLCNIYESIYCDKYINNNIYGEYQNKLKSKYIAVNIMSFLYREINPNYNQYKISCLVKNCRIRSKNDKSSKLLYLMGLRQYIHSVYIEGIKNGQKMVDPQDTIYFCDLCKIECSEYEYMYHCDSTMCDRHDICITCCYNIIKQHNQLCNELKSILKYQLCDDCITQIVHFVTGKVVQL